MAQLIGTELADIMRPGEMSFFAGIGNGWMSPGGGADRIDGRGGNDTLDGGGGHDTINGGAGNDLIHGGAGNDRLYGDSGIDTMYGGAGDDYYSLDTSADQVREYNGAVGGVDTVAASFSYVLANDLENLILTGSARLDGRGNAAGNVLVGNAGDNVLQGLAGNDELRGGAGRDLLDGGDGDDVLIGGAGADVLIGAAGADRFVLTNVGDRTDQIHTFQGAGVAGGDIIDLSMLDTYFWTPSQINLLDGVWLTNAENGDTTVYMGQHGNIYELARIVDGAVSAAIYQAEDFIF